MGAFHSSKTANGAVSASKQLIYREMESLGRHETPWNSISGDPYGTRTRVFAVRGLILDILAQSGTPRKHLNSAIL